MMIFTQCGDFIQPIDQLHQLLMLTVDAIDTNQ
jgi:hypothetical protein